MPDLAVTESSPAACPSNSNRSLPPWMVTQASVFPFYSYAKSSSVLPAVVPYPTPHGTASNVHIKRKKAKDATSVGGSTAIARTLMLQGLYLFYRTPIKLFRPLRVDYLIMARALMPVDENSKRFSFRYTSIGMITHAVKTHGWSFLPKHVFPPLFANTMIGTVLYTTYIATLPMFHAPSAYQLHRPFPPPPYSSVFLAGCLAGAAQSIVAAPLDSLKVRFEVNDLLEGKHQSLYQFAKTTLKELGIASAYRGFTLTLLRDSLACGLFFATFEWVKQQGYYYFLDEMYGLHVVSSKTLHDLELAWKEDPPTQDNQTITCDNIDRPPLLLEPMFVILAGAFAAVVWTEEGVWHGDLPFFFFFQTPKAYQLIDHPFSKIHSIFYIEEGQSEFTHKKREPVNELYRRTWEQCKLQVRLNGGSWMRFLYQEFGSTVLKVVPATSVGFLVFELVKREVDFRSIDFDSFPTLDEDSPADTLHGNDLTPSSSH
ncbi:mitochondrial carrier [Hesseltinella vesiculosa]|uniref:Mitochondrial carrier n=1 Tax=Hesseltinella vesiculosa TaxID=101127 RepID=A0A1X2GWN9_9FUNG|nr:mitochondrial carrier [Hesseltinella vesiculosa]